MKQTTASHPQKTSWVTPPSIIRNAVVALVASLLFTVSVCAAPPKIITMDANYQQAQVLPDIELQQGANATLQFQLLTKTAYQDLTGLTARWEGRETITSTQALVVASSTTQTNTYPHYFECLLDSTETGTAVTNWVWSLVVIEGAGQYPIGVGDLDIDASAWTGAGAILTNATSKAYTDAAIAAHAAVSNAHHTRYTDLEATDAGVAYGFVTNAIGTDVSNLVYYTLTTDVDATNIAQNVIIASNTAGVASNAVNIASNTADIATNTATIAAHTNLSLASGAHGGELDPVWGAVSNSVTSDIATNASDLSTHEGLTGASVHGLGTASTSDTGDFATAAQGATADAAIPKAGGVDITGDLSFRDGVGASPALGFYNGAFFGISMYYSTNNTFIMNSGGTDIQMNGGLIMGDGVSASRAVTFTNASGHSASVSMRANGQLDVTSVNSNVFIAAGSGAKIYLVGAVDANGEKIENLAAGTANSDAVNKGQMDTAIAAGGGGGGGYADLLAQFDGSWRKGSAGLAWASYAVDSAQTVFTVWDDTLDEVTAYERLSVGSSPSTNMTVVVRYFSDDTSGGTVVDAWTVDGTTYYHTNTLTSAAVDAANSEVFTNTINDTWAGRIPARWGYRGSTATATGNVYGVVERLEVGQQ